MVFFLSCRFWSEGSLKGLWMPVGLCECVLSRESVNG